VTVKLLLAECGWRFDAITTNKRENAAPESLRDTTGKSAETRLGTSTQIQMNAACPDASVARKFLNLSDEGFTHAHSV